MVQRGRRKLARFHSYNFRLTDFLIGVTQSEILGKNEMKATKVQNCLSLYGGTSATRAESIATALRTQGLLPKGGRGLSAPMLTSREIALFALAVAGAETVADAAALAVDLAALVDHGGVSLIDAMEPLVEDQQAAREITAILVLAQSTMVRFDRRDGSYSYFSKPSAWSDDGFVANAQGQGFAGRIGWIGGAVLQQIAIENSPVDDDEGELVG